MPRYAGGFDRALRQRPMIEKSMPISPETQPGAVLDRGLARLWQGYRSKPFLDRPQETFLDSRFRDNCRSRHSEQAPRSYSDGASHATPPPPPPTASERRIARASFAPAGTPSSQAR
jgi:hypothetical protein